MAPAMFDEEDWKPEDEVDNPITSDEIDEFRRFLAAIPDAQR